MDVVDGKQTRSAQPSGHGRNQSGHPIIAVNKVGLNSGKDIVDDFPLKAERYLSVIWSTPVRYIVQVEKTSIFGKVDPGLRQSNFDGVIFPSDNRR